MEKYIVYDIDTHDKLAVIYDLESLEVFMAALFMYDLVDNVQIQRVKK